MRYPPEHKQRTRQKIIRKAGRLFKRKGYSGVGIDTIMEAAGLTRGGFYGYFRSKGELFAQVLAGGENDFIDKLRKRPGPDAQALNEQALEVVSGYLAYENRDAVGRGCNLASLSIDAARADRGSRRAYTAHVAEWVGEFQRGLGPASEEQALRALALCVGGVVVGRALDDPKLARALLEACRGQVAEELEAG
ncbi:MAG: TetR/AcrR family transcriptional regulator [bacterium]|nr:TetR/AcrR family transcriptional regulator [bacterium]MCP5069999.1 TetR/AcrR family transcriptional regulator [bacterium]